MTDPTHAAPESSPWRLTLEHGDRLEVRPPAQTDGGSSEPQIVLTLRPYRATELGVVLDRYNRLAGIFAESSDIWTEDSLARGLRDAPAAISDQATSQHPSKVGTAERGRAMVILQQARPELTHDQLVAVVDATAWWLDSDEDYKATDLLDSVAGAEVSSEVYMTLLDWKPPAPPTPTHQPGTARSSDDTDD
jgi:hypothetical protein